MHSGLGKPLPREDLMKMIGWTEADVRHGALLNESCQAGGREMMMEEIHRRSKTADSRPFALLRPSFRMLHDVGGGANTRHIKQRQQQSVDRQNFYLGWGVMGWPRSQGAASQALPRG
jgi:hypothetical protein